MIRVTYNVARRVAGAFERLIFNALDRYIRTLPADGPATPAAPASRCAISGSGSTAPPTGPGD